MFSTLALYRFFLTTSLFTASLSLLNPAGTGTNLLTSSSSTIFSNCLNLSISTLSASDFKLAKSVLLAKLDASTPVAFLKSAYVA